MTRRDLADSIDDIFEVQDSHVDPGAAQWHNWAVKASQQSVKDSTLAGLLPFESTFYSQARSSRHVTPSSTSSNSSHPQSSPVPSSSSSSIDVKEEPVDDIKPAYMNANIQHLFSDPPHCFCRLVASRSETPYFGVTYDCHHMKAPYTTTDNKKCSATTTTICGFHVHERAWKAIGALIQSDNIIHKNNPELSTCPYFNFTFCVTFNLSNTMKKSSPRGPECFCKRPVILSESDNVRNARLCFVCPNFYIAGAKPKCSWFLWAEELAFSKPRHPRHSPLFLEEAQERIKTFQSRRGAARDLSEEDDHGSVSYSSSSTEASFHDASSTA